MAPSCSWDKAYQGPGCEIRPPSAFGFLSCLCRLYSLLNQLFVIPPPPTMLLLHGPLLTLFPCLPVLLFSQVLYDSDENPWPVDPMWAAYLPAFHMCPGDNVLAGENHCAKFLREIFFLSIKW
ncbi:hypothetical protein DBR06_SOUSAS210223 [Sousa chinensis]|uniref:Uncharacterized protein n=1 Tax=Sousa chinensis TaxID=103600 RepID=A0A484GMY6_SOUCH|nr:hypothetical protein DBR06_SOUSAS210223 [Sousa chinensis]